MGTALQVADQHDAEVEPRSLDASLPRATSATRTDGAGGPGEPQPTSDHAPSTDPTTGNVRVLVGHYGSGKTEVAVSLAMRLASHGRRVAVGDLDIVNPYFRSRELAEVMTAAGIRVVSSMLGHDAAIDLPAISPEIRSLLADPAADVILDVGGNEIGAKVLVDYRPDLRRRAAETLLVVNAYRPDTGDVAGVLRHLRAIETTSGLAVGGLVCNTHVCRDTTVDAVVAGYRLTREVSQATGTPIRYVCAIPSALAGLPERLDEQVAGELLPIGLYLRPSWL